MMLWLRQSVLLWIHNMLQPLSELFNNTRNVSWGDDDVKHVLQQYLRTELLSELVYCQEVRSGSVVVRVGTPALQQGVFLLERDMRLMLKKEVKYSLRRLRVSL